MIVESVNLSEGRTIVHGGKEEQTGIWKLPVDGSIFLGKEGVNSDVVADKIHHGGVHKAVYLFGLEKYSGWKIKYQNLDWCLGMFGENITISGLNESTMKIGERYSIGEAIVRITQPRQPCYKLGIRFEDVEIVNQFRLGSDPGVYVAVEKPGWVTKGDTMSLITSREESLTVLEVFRLIYASEPDRVHLQRALEDILLAPNVTQYLLKKYSNFL
jgi:MOSC domain-containing protein YiiM